MRNFLVTLFCSQGVPMLLAGDEMGRTQRGNNNAYCQDTELSWVDWDNAVKHADLLDFTRGLSQLRREHPVFRRRRFFSGRPPAGGDGKLRDIVWLTPSGREMNSGDWRAEYAKALAVFLNGDAITEPDPRGEQVRDDHFLLLFNAHSEAVEFLLPGADFAPGWQLVIDTAVAATPAVARRPGASVEVTARSVVVLRAAASRAPAGRRR